MHLDIAEDDRRTGATIVETTRLERKESFEDRAPRAFGITVSILVSLVILAVALFAWLTLGAVAGLVALLLAIGMAVVANPTAVAALLRIRDRTRIQRIERIERHEAAPDTQDPRSDPRRAPNEALTSGEG
ncbi:MAG: hypothetical protein H6811_01405 [Phycisphaeraceae bacterium]|nr:hypothetical protein [Phycisphaeraceae bacterium]